MGIKRHEDILAWQLGQELSLRLAAILGQSAARRDREYCSEVQAAADAISANIAEGFDRYRLRQFRYFLEIANGSLGETSTRVRQGYARGYFSERQLNELLILCKRTRKLLTPLITSVEAEDNRRRHNLKAKNEGCESQPPNKRPETVGFERAREGEFPGELTTSVSAGPGSLSSRGTRRRQFHEDPTASVPKDSAALVP